MCDHGNNSEGIAYKSRRADRTGANYDLFSGQQYNKNEIRGDY